MPSPIDTLLRVQASPVPTQTFFGLEGSSAIAPIDCTGCSSKTGLKVVPPSVDFHTPPLAAPPNSVTLPDGSVDPARAEIRPLMVAEPMLRAPRPEIVPESITVAPAPTAASAAKAQLTPDTNTHVNAASSIRISLLLELPGRGGAGARGGKVEHDIVGGDVRFSFVELHLLAIGGALGAGFLGKRKVDPIHFL